MKRFLYIHILFLLAVSTSYAQSVPSTKVPDNQVRWITYPGDFGIFAHKKLVVQRTERNQNVPPSLWRVDSPYGIVEFSKRIKLDKPERASLQTDGRFYIRGIAREGTMYDFDPNDFELPAGDYTIVVVVENFDGLPAIRFESPTYRSDKTWTVHSANFDRVAAEELQFTAVNMLPSQYALSVTPIEGNILEKKDSGLLLDFGKQTFAFPVFHQLRGNGTVHVFYGESKEEALAGKVAETWDKFEVSAQQAYNDTLMTKAFRYVHIQTDGDVTFDHFSALYEYLPLSYRGSFESSDTLLNKIYDVSYYTLHLNTREVHLDGIKRDRWAWSGDAYQSNLMNFYTFFDEDVNKRTMWGLRGHEPQTRHLNTILDYTFYWLIGIYEHYLYTGDTEFIKQIYPRMKSTMEFCMSRLNKDGIAEGVRGDWVFIDWAPIDKTGELSFEQLLFIRSLEAFSVCASLVNDETSKNKYEKLYEQKRAQFDEIFWSDEHKAYLHHRKEGKLTSTVTRYANMFAILYDMVDDDRKALIRDNVILNNNVLAITTPYMKFYELAALCEINEHEKVLDFVREYWGGMLRLGATSFWEAYDPTLPDDQHYAMYDRPFGKSLCHAWGANPVYLFGRYYLGVRPTKAGYQEYLIEPHLGGLEWMKGAVPTPMGDIKLHICKNKITVETPGSTGGTVRFRSKKKPKASNGMVQVVQGNLYELKLDKANTVFEIELR